MFSDYGVFLWEINMFQVTADITPMLCSTSATLMGPVLQFFPVCCGSPSTILEQTPPQATTKRSICLQSTKTRFICLLFINRRVILTQTPPTIQREIMTALWTTGEWIEPDTLENKGWFHISNTQRFLHKSDELST